MILSKKNFYAQSTIVLGRGVFLPNVYSGSFLPCRLSTFLVLAPRSFIRSIACNGTNGILFAGLSEQVRRCLKKRFNRIVSDSFIARDGATRFLEI